MLKVVFCFAIMLSILSTGISAPLDGELPDTAIQATQVALPQFNYRPVDAKGADGYSPNHDFPFSASRILLFGATGADLGTTWHELSQNRREANPMLGQSRVMQGVIVGSSVVALTFLTARLHHNGYNKLATVLNFVVAGEHSFAAWHNVRN